MFRRYWRTLEGSSDWFEACQLATNCMEHAVPIFGCVRVAYCSPALCTSMSSFSSSDICSVHFCLLTVSPENQPISLIHQTLLIPTNHKPFRFANHLLRIWWESFNLTKTALQISNCTPHSQLCLSALDMTASSLPRCSDGTACTADVARFAILF